jgi:hypothetical protein
MTPEQEEALLDSLVEEKRIKKQSLRYSSYLPTIRSWKLWRSRNTPFGFTEDVDHVCTVRECKATGNIQNLIHGSKPPIYGCKTSGMIHICEAPRISCPYTYTDGDCVHKCVFSGAGEQRVVAHSWKQFNPEASRNRNYGLSHTTKAAIVSSSLSSYYGEPLESVGCDAYRSGGRTLTVSKSKEDADAILDEWVIDMEKMLLDGDDVESPRAKTHSPKKDSDVSRLLSAGSRAHVIKRKTHLVKPKEPEKKTLHGVDSSLSELNSLQGESTVVSMNDVMGVATTPLRTPMLSATPLMCTPSPMLQTTPSKAMVDTLLRTFGGAPSPALLNYIELGGMCDSGTTPVMSSTPVALSVGTPTRAVSTYGDTPLGKGAYSNKKMHNGGFVFEHPEDQEEKERKEAALTSHMAPREKEYAQLREKQRKERALMLETQQNLTTLKQDTDAILSDLVWDSRARRNIHTKRVEEAEEKACRKLTEYIKKSHSFRMKIQNIRTKVPLYPSMFEMDSIYWSTINSVPSLVVATRDHRRKDYYSTLSGKLWRFISYYGDDCSETPEKTVSYAAFVTGVLYTLKQDGLVLDSNVWIPPDPFLQKNLPLPGDLDWRPKRNILINLRTEGGRSGCTPRSGKAPSMKYTGQSSTMPPPSSVSKKRNRNVKTLHTHLHGEVGTRGATSSRQAFYRRKKRRANEPPGWKPTGTICTSKKGLAEHFGYGNRGRTYSRSIITSGRNYIKHFMRKFADPEFSVPLRKILEPEIQFYQTHLMKTFSNGTRGVC